MNFSPRKDWNMAQNYVKFAVCTLLSVVPWYLRRGSSPRADLRCMRQLLLLAFFANHVIYILRSLRQTCGYRRFHIAHAFREATFSLQFRSSTIRVGIVRRLNSTGIRKFLPRFLEQATHLYRNRPFRWLIVALAIVSTLSNLFPEVLWVTQPPSFSHLLYSHSILHFLLTRCHA